MRVSYLGPAGTFSEEALDAAARGGRFEPVPRTTIHAAIEAVESGDADRAFVPFENSIEGTVRPTLDALAFEAGGIEIVGEFDHEVRQALIAVAQRDGLELIAGHNKEVVVTRSEHVLFPRKGQEPEKAAELEAALRATPWWQQVSTLSPAQLKAAWDLASGPNPDLRRILERFAWTERETSTRLRDRRDH